MGRSAAPGRTRSGGEHNMMMRLPREKKPFARLRRDAVRDAATRSRASRAPRPRRRVPSEPTPRSIPPRARSVRTHDGEILEERGGGELLLSGRHELRGDLLGVGRGDGADAGRLLHAARGEGAGHGRLVEVQGERHRGWMLGDDVRVECRARSESARLFGVPARRGKAQRRRSNESGRVLSNHRSKIRASMREC